MALKFSVITPTLNGLEQLKHCVGSIRGQTGVDVEHIIQDGCSTDGTVEWLKSQVDICFCSEPDSGMYEAINKGWRRANGDILSWLNSDEQYLPGTVEHVQRIFLMNPDVDFIYGNYIVVDEDGLPIAARREIRLSKAYIANGSLNAASCTMFFRRRLLDKGMLTFNDYYRYAADMELVLKLISSGIKVRHVDSYLSLFTFDGSNLSCSPLMIDETKAVRASFGGFSNNILRKIVITGRVVEKLMKGCYLPADLEYKYAINDKPDYFLVRAAKVFNLYVT